MAHASLPPCGADEALRLFAADELLESGITPEALLKAQGLDLAPLARNYNPNQPRVPAGNGRLRDEFLNETLFTSPMQARQALEEWRCDYNLVRPHSSIGWLAPAIYASQFSPPRGQDAALRNGSAPWPVAPSVYDASNCQTLAATG